MSTPVKPIESFGASAQRELEQFNHKYNAAFAAQPISWAQVLGDMLPGDSLKETYPIAFEVQKYKEVATQNAKALDTKIKDVTVIKREFATAAEVELRRIVRGDQAQILQWNRKPEQMARGRIILRNELIAALIETGETAATSVLDGEAFFSATHKVNPFDASIEYQGSATWSNFQSAATPLNAANLTAEKTAFKQTPGPDGEELGLEATHILVPTALDDTAYNLLSVQDLILSGVLAGGGDGTMGQVRNVHYNSGLSKVRGSQLTGNGANSDWYLLSSTAFDMGLFPWVLAEDATDELRNWDESSDYYKAHGRIKVESRILAEAAFLFPHGIRKISGS